MPTENTAFAILRIDMLKLYPLRLGKECTLFGVVRVGVVGRRLVTSAIDSEIELTSISHLLEGREERSTYLYTVFAIEEYAATVCRVCDVERKVGATGIADYELSELVYGVVVDSLEPCVEGKPLEQFVGLVVDNLYLFYINLHVAIYLLGCHLVGSGIGYDSPLHYDEGVFVEHLAIF